jgi:hypothetical protein
LLANYYTDRFSLMRTWKKAPHVSTEMSTYSRIFFYFSLCCLGRNELFLLVWSAFHFVNLCKVDSTTMGSDDHFGEYTLNLTKNNDDDGTFPYEDVTIDTNSAVYTFCAQDFILREGGPNFPLYYYLHRRTGWW